MSRRTEFSKEDDRFLAKWMVDHPGAKTAGNKLYKELEEVNERHSWHSWRERYLKNCEAIELLMKLERRARKRANAAEQSGGDENPMSNETKNALKEKRRAERRREEEEAERKEQEQADLEKRNRLKRKKMEKTQEREKAREKEETERKTQKQRKANVGKGKQRTRDHRSPSPEYVSPGASVRSSVFRPVDASATIGDEKRAMKASTSGSRKRARSRSASTSSKRLELYPASRQSDEAALDKMGKGNKEGDDEGVQEEVGQSTSRPSKSWSALNKGKGRATEPSPEPISLHDELLLSAFIAKLPAGDIRCLDAVHQCFVNDYPVSISWQTSQAYYLAHRDQFNSIQHTSFSATPDPATQELSQLLVPRHPPAQLPEAEPLPPSKSTKKRARMVTESEEEDEPLVAGPSKDAWLPPQRKKAKPANVVANGQEKPSLPKVAIDEEVVPLAMSDGPQPVANQVPLSTPLPPSSEAHAIALPPKSTTKPSLKPRSPTPDPPSPNLSTPEQLSPQLEAELLKSRLVLSPRRSLLDRIGQKGWDILKQMKTGAIVHSGLDVEEEMERFIMRREESESGKEDEETDSEEETAENAREEEEEEEEEEEREEEDKERAEGGGGTAGSRSMLGLGDDEGHSDDERERSDEGQEFNDEEQEPNGDEEKSELADSEDDVYGGDELDAQKLKELLGLDEELEYEEEEDDDELDEDMLADSNDIGKVAPTPLGPRNILVPDSDSDDEPRVAQPTRSLEVLAGPRSRVKAVHQSPDVGGSAARDVSSQSSGSALVAAQLLSSIKKPNIAALVPRHSAPAHAFSTVDAADPPNAKPSNRARYSGAHVDAVIRNYSRPRKSILDLSRDELAATFAAQKLMESTAEAPQIPLITPKAEALLDLTSVLQSGGTDAWRQRASTASTSARTAPSGASTVPSDTKRRKARVAEVRPHSTPRPMASTTLSSKDLTTNDLSAMVGQMSEKYRLDPDQALGIFYCSGDWTLAHEYATLLCDMSSMENPVEYEEHLAKVTAMVWKPEEDEVAMLGTPKEWERLDRRKGKGGTKNRRNFLAGMGWHKGRSRQYPFDG